MSHIFISYSKQNSVYAYALADKLRAEGFDVWIDRSQLHTSQSWWPEIVQGLRGCSAFVVILTAQSDSSKWVQREILLADKWNKQSFPLLLEGDIESDNWSIFVGTQYADVRDGALPPPALYDDLAKYASRRSRPGVDVTEKPSTVPIDAEVRQEIANPPPPETGNIAQERIQAARPQQTRINPRTLMVISALILVALLIIFAPTIFRPVENPTPTLSATFAPEIVETSLAINRLDITATEIMFQRTVDAKETENSQSFAESTQIAATAHAQSAATKPPLPNTTATQVIDLGATATEALMQRTVVAQGVINATLQAENTRIVGTSTLTASPSPTPSKTPTSTQIPTATSIVSTATQIGERGYPCDAQTISRGSTKLNVVRANPSSGSPAEPAIQQGVVIRILQKVETPTDTWKVWYQIASLNEDVLGWIPAEYIVLSFTCPE